MSPCATRREMALSASPQKRKRDVVAKSTGTQIYGIDMQMDGMVIATTHQSGNCRRGLNSFEAEAARNRCRGVHIAFDDHRWHLLVVADNTWRAFQAAQALTVTGAVALQSATAPTSFFRGQWRPPSPNDHRAAVFKDGSDVEEALQDASVVWQNNRIPYLAPRPMEPMSVVVS